MMGWLLSFLPRHWLSSALAEQWARSLPRDQRIRFYHWGATGDRAHHEFQWADKLTSPNPESDLHHG